MVHKNAVNRRGLIDAGPAGLGGNGKMFTLNVAVSFRLGKNERCNLSVGNLQ